MKIVVVQTDADTEGSVYPQRGDELLPGLHPWPPTRENRLEAFNELGQGAVVLGNECDNSNVHTGGGDIVNIAVGETKEVKLKFPKITMRLRGERE